MGKIIPAWMQRTAEINNLLGHLSNKVRKLNREKINRVLRQENFFFLCAYCGSVKSGQLIGMGSIYFEETLTGFKGYIEDVVVHPDHRGQGVGRRLMEGLLALAKKKKADWIDLTSAPKRKAANILYRKLGFKKRRTNVYRLVLAP